MEKNEVQLVKRISLPPAKERSRSRQRKPLLPRLNHKSSEKTVNKSHSIGIRYYKLPDNYPGRFATYSTFKNQNGEKVPLIHRDTVETILTELDRDIQPVMARFNLYYAALSEPPAEGEGGDDFSDPPQVLRTQRLRTPHKTEGEEPEGT